MDIKCNKCGHIGDASEFPKGRDFFSKEYVAGCPKCDNRQNPGDASMRMFGGSRPFETVRPDASRTALEKVLHDADNAA